MNGYNFTERVRRVLMIAREEAMGLHHEYVGTEHILLGLVGEGEGVAAATLRNLGIDGNRLREEILRVVRPGNPDPGVRGPDLPYTSRSKKVLELAMSEARSRNHSYVGTEHLLIGLLVEERGIGAQVLASQGATVANVSSEVRRLLGPEGGEPHQSAPRRRRAAPDRAAAITVVVEHPDGRIEAKKFRTSGDAARFLAELEL